jgi:hypothetical protein
MVFLTPTAECFFVPSIMSRTALVTDAVKPTASKGLTFSVSGFEGVDQLGISIYRQIGVVRSHDELRFD